MRFRRRGPGPPGRAGLPRRAGRRARSRTDRARAAELAQAEAELAAARRAAAPGLAAAIEDRLRQLAMPRARFGVEVGDDEAARTVTWLLAANPGEPLLPLAKVASGGELARTMLAVRLVLGGAPTGGRRRRRPARRRRPDAGLRRGRRRHRRRGGRRRRPGPGRPRPATTRSWSSPTWPRWRPSPTSRSPCARPRSTAGPWPASTSSTDRQRVVELSRMLSGQPDSATGPPPRRGAAGQRPEPNGEASRSEPGRSASEPSRSAVRVSWPSWVHPRSALVVSAPTDGNRADLRSWLWRSTSSSPAAWRVRWARA